MMDKLIRAIESGDDQFSSYLPAEHQKVWARIYLAYDGSLDAAKAVHDAIVPGWMYNVADGYCHVFPNVDGGVDYAFTGVNPITARAWLLAVLKAYQDKILSQK